ncbi:NB-ARC domain-containing protein [Streptomyces kaempferi]
MHAAHSLAPFFPDGQFALDLHGMDMELADPCEALARLLRALGVADRGIPPGTEDRSGLLRSILAERRVLLLLDNAGNEAQVRPLLPATGHSLTIVTSRNALAGLEAVHRTELSVLRREEAVELLTRIVGPERVSAEAQAARDLADLCGNLPLAVRIVGQRLAARPGERLRKLVGLLAQEERRLDALQAGGLQVRAAFALSYRRLGPYGLPSRVPRGGQGFRARNGRSARGPLVGGGRAVRRGTDRRGPASATSLRGTLPLPRSAPAVRRGAGRHRGRPRDLRRRPRPDRPVDAAPGHRRSTALRRRPTPGHPRRRPGPRHRSRRP